MMLKDGFLAPGRSRRDAEHPVQQSVLSRPKDRRGLWWEGQQSHHPGLHHIGGGLEVGAGLEASLQT